MIDRAGVLAFGMTTAVKVIVGVVFRSQQRPGIGAGELRPPDQHAAKMPVRVDVAVLNQAAVGIAAGGVVPEVIPCGQGLLSQGNGCLLGWS